MGAVHEEGRDVSDLAGHVGDVDVGAGRVLRGGGVLLPSQRLERDAAGDGGALAGVRADVQVGMLGGQLDGLGDVVGALPQHNSLA